MSKNPAVDKASTVLSEDMDKSTTTFVAVAKNTEPEPTASDAKVEASGTYQWRLFRDGKQLGYLGVDCNSWAKIVSQEHALPIESFPHNGVVYYRVHGSDRYMSVSDRAYVGFYNWSGATGFTKVGNGFRSDYNHQDLSYDNKENDYLTCWNTYARLEVFK